jgi:prepilin-type N-terminal cleavage/methylation domain-containing protein
MLATLLKFRQKVPGRSPQRRGFTMVEIMVVIGIVGIIASISAPPIFRYVQSNRLQTNTDRLAADLQYARSLSIASSQILRFTATPLGYELSNPNTGVVIRATDFAHDMELGANQTTDFYPWGMADAAIFNITNGSGTKRINLLPTGLVEVY